MNDKSHTRIAGLDVLRTIAVLLVLVRHSACEQNIWYRFGWLGVDLFFVISGFLVSGLLFAEYKKYGRVRIKRFLIRRGFKIYPSFYFLLFVTLLVDHFAKGISPSIAQLAAELLYVQNYFQGILTHSWSLAVEEHFYILLAGSVFLLLRLNKFHPGKKTIVIVSSLIAVQVLVRMLIYYSSPHFSFEQTHMRADGILIGLLVACLFHFTNIPVRAHRYRFWLVPLAILMLLPGFLFPAGSVLMHTVGLSIVCIGFGLLTLLIVGRHQVKPVEHILVDMIGFPGIHSYSIYLWHLLGNAVLLHFLHFNDTVMTALYIVFSLAIGIFFSLTIEKFFLRMRETERVKKWY